jgi:hypothetical protein
VGPSYRPSGFSSQKAKALLRTSAADLKFLHYLLRVRLGTSNRRAALEK